MPTAGLPTATPFNSAARQGTSGNENAGAPDRPGPAVTSSARAGATARSGVADAVRARFSQRVVIAASGGRVGRWRDYGSGRKSGQPSWSRVQDTVEENGT
ncbi:hypothetical protein Sgou_60620 [Streptomyces gougerotii]|uniref:Uncharacterized protein n=1 Tax=Streptomyces gougerotii TaxID=53448 RepID=A0A8H9HSV3_9ACTN|nr:hypothetical protein Sgou_60620 [Streptomyces gougerotii]GGU76068.1 hypothetical protein GCM10010227_32920 [Streptomyces gougerotii]